MPMPTILGQSVCYSLETAELLTDSVGERDLLRNQLWTIVDYRGVREPQFTLQNAEGRTRLAMRDELEICGASGEECRFFTARGWAIHV